MELNPWVHLSNDDLKKFLTDPMNDENAPDRKLVIEHLKHKFYLLRFRFLDIGCGTGNMYLTLKQSGLDFEYVGVDKTPKMVEFAQKRFPEAKFMQGDIHSLPFTDCSWNVIYARHVIDHLPGYERALSELARACSDYLIICLLKPLADKQEIKVIGKPPSQTKPGEFSEHFLNTYAHKPFMQTLEKLGFNVVVDQLVQVGGFFKFYEVIIARRIGVEEIAKIEKLQTELSHRISNLRAEVGREVP